MNLNKRQQYLDLGNQLPNKYYHLKFDNNDYWRIALDNTLFAPWKEVVPAPAYRNITEEQLDYVIHLLKNYLTDEQLLIEHHRISLAYRGKK